MCYAFGANTYPDILEQVFLVMFLFYQYDEISSLNWLHLNKLIGRNVRLKIPRGHFLGGSLHKQQQQTFSHAFYLTWPHNSVPSTVRQRVKSTPLSLVHKKFLFTVTWETSVVEMEGGHLPWKLMVQRYLLIDQHQLVLLPFTTITKLIPLTLLCGLSWF